MTNDNNTENGIARLHYASARSGAHRALHTNKDCADLQQATGTNSAPITNVPRGSICDRCEPENTLADVRAELLDVDSDESELPAACPACGYAQTSADPDEWWGRTPQGRPKCPDCGAIPDGCELASRQEVPADD